MNLEFKSWFNESAFGMRDVRFGRHIVDKDNPPLHNRIGSDVVTGVGNVFRKRMGAAFPVYGSGYQPVFDPLTKAFTNSGNFVVVRYEAYEPEKDNLRGKYRTNLADKALLNIRSMAHIEEEAQRSGTSIRNRPDDVDFEPEKDRIKITFKFKLRDKSADRFRLTQKDA